MCRCQRLTIKILKMANRLIFPFNKDPLHDYKAKKNTKIRKGYCDHKVTKKRITALPVIVYSAKGLKIQNSFQPRSLLRLFYVATHVAKFFSY